MHVLYVLKSTLALHYFIPFFNIIIITIGVVILQFNPTTRQWNVYIYLMYDVLAVCYK